MSGNTAWGPSKTWRWGDYYHRWELSYYSKDRRARGYRWEFHVNGYGSAAGNPLSAIWRGWRFSKAKQLPHE